MQYTLEFEKTQEELRKMYKNIEEKYGINFNEEVHLPVRAGWTPEMYNEAYRKFVAVDNRSFFQKVKEKFMPTPIRRNYMATVKSIVYTSGKYRIVLMDDGTYMVQKRGHAVSVPVAGAAHWHFQGRYDRETGDFHAFTFDTQPDAMVYIRSK